MADDDKTRWMTDHGEGFGTLTGQDDFLHPQGNPPGDTVTETYYFGFHIAEEAIHGYVYVWFHPNLGVVTAGTMISRGFQRSVLSADHTDIRAYLSMESCVDRATGVMTFPSGLTLTPIEPMVRWAAKLSSPATDTSFDLLFVAAQPPAVRADRKHFDQNMHVTGELVLRGKKHRVDCYQIRDRSWNNLRPEDHMPVPPFDWLCLTRGKDFAMNLSVFDDLALLGNPGGQIKVPPNLLLDGWVFVDGGFRRIVDVKKRTERTRDVLMPLRHEVVAIDDKGARYDIVGDSVGGCNWAGWPNMFWHQNLIRWTCNGQACWGESQEVQWNDAVRLLSQTAYPTAA